MKKILLSFLLLLSCNQLSDDGIGFVIAEKDLIPEGIAYSASNNSFYVSSINKTKIVQVNAQTGEFQDFIKSDVLGLKVIGMIVDESENNLWACSFNFKDNIGTSTVAKFNLTDGELLKSYTLTDSVENIFNDLVLDKFGNVYFTNTSGKTIFLISSETDTMEVFYKGEEIEYPNGITISPDNKYLYIASAKNGIRVLDIKNKLFLEETESNINSKGIDGLKYYQGSLYAIQNDIGDQSKINIAKYFLNKDGTKITGLEIIDENNSLFDIPTTFVIAKNKLYCVANSQLGNYSNDKILDEAALKDVIILKYDL